MKTLLLLALTVPLFGQAVRVDPTPVFQTTAQSGLGLNPVVAVANSTIYVCMAPASGNPCTNFAVGYTDATAAFACPSSQPVVLRGTNTCTAYSDAQGNFGFWLTPGNYFYQVQTPQGQIYGPWPITAGSSSSGGATIPSVTNLIQGNGSGNGADSGVAASTLITTANSNTLPVSRTTGNPITAGANISFGSSTWPNLTISSAGSGGSGSLSGPLSTATIIGATPGILRDEQQSLDLGNKTSNGIATAIANCFTNGGICNADVSYLYGTSEAVPGYGMNWFVFTPSAPSALPTQSSNGTSVFDHRYGWYPVAYNHPGNNSGNYHFWSHWNSLYNDPSWIVPADNIGALNIETAFLHGGRNASANGSTDKTSVSGLTVAALKWGQNQQITAQFNNGCYAGGDCITMSEYTVGYGGMNAQTDEGTHNGDRIVLSGNVEDSGTITSSNASTGATSITVTETQGATTAGQGRYAMLGSPVTGTIATGGISSPGSSYTTITANGTPFTASSVIGTIGTAISVTPGSLVTATIAPSSYAAGSISGYTVGSIVCLSDAGAYELGKILTNTGSAFTVSLDRSFSSSAIAAVGGCGYGFDITADDASSSSPHTSVAIRAITGTLHKPIPVAYTTSTSVTKLWYSVAALFDALNTLETNSANAFSMWPLAEIQNVVTAGAVSSTWTLGPNIGTTSASTPYFVPIDFRARFTMGQNIVESYLMASRNMPVNAGLFYNSPLTGTSSMWMLANNGSPTLYATNGGTQSGPYALPISGEHSIAVWEKVTPGNAAHEVDCPNLTYNTCNKTFAFLKAQNGDSTGTLFDYLHYTQTAGAETWDMTVGNGAYDQFWYKDGVTLPMVADGSVANPPTGQVKQYYSTTQSAACTKTSTGSVVCGSGGGTVNTPASAGTYTVTGTSTGTAVPISTPTLITLLPTCASMASGVISGPCITPSGASGFFEYTDTETGTSYPIPASDAWGILIFNSASAVNAAMPQAGVGTNFPAGSYLTISNYGAGAVTITATTSNIGPSTNVRIIPAASGSGSSLVTHGCRLTSNGTNYSLSLCN